uniref:Uncharacterized protein n=1 Tax=Avena sativa TaxID=4498 RepID=A0ACD5U616_AVESA
MMVVVTPQDIGRPTARTEGAEVDGGACRWAAPIFEATKLPAGKDKIYQFLVYETGSSKAALLGEATANLAEYADALKPSAVTLPLKGSPAPGALLHVTIQRVVGGGAGGCGDDVSENGDTAKFSPRRTLQSQLSRYEDEDGEKARSLAAADSMSPTIHDANGSGKRLSNVEDPWSQVEELKQELGHEKNLNADLRVQLQKMQESNSELLLAVKDLDELLEQKDRDISIFQQETVDDPQEAEYEHALSNVHSAGHKMDMSETSSYQEKEDELMLDALVKKSDGIGSSELEEKIVELSDEIELYKKDREDLEMQMEQLALDYEILKQENHDISSRLEQTQLREQLRMQYECSAHLSIISDLEANVENLENELQTQSTKVENLENELQTQSERLEADIAEVLSAKVEQEQRAIKAEDALRKARWNNATTAERLQEEFKNERGQLMEKNQQKDMELATSGEKDMALEDKNAEITLLGEELALLKGQVQTYLDELNTVKRSRNEKDEAIGKLHINIGSLKLQYENIKKLLSTKESEKSNLASQVLKLRRALESREGAKENGITSDTTEDQHTNSKRIKHNTGSSDATPIVDIHSNGHDTRGAGAHADQCAKELDTLKEMNKVMQQELNELHERYSEISLKFAEVEGERQQLVMTVRTLKNTLR